MPVTTRSQHMRNSQLHAPTGSTILAFPSPFPSPSPATVKLAASQSTMNTTGVRCTCGKLCKDELGLRQHMLASKVHRNAKAFAAGNVNSDANFLGFRGDGDKIPSSSTPLHSQQVTASSASSSAIPTSAAVSKSSKIGGALVNYPSCLM